MRKSVKHMWILVIHCLVCLISVVIFNKNFSLLAYINILFYIGLFYLSLGLLLFVISKKFFDITAISFRKVFTRPSKKRQWTEEEAYRLPSERIRSATYHFFIIQGSGMLVVMVGFLIGFYF